MAVTLEQAKSFVQEDFDPFVIDTFRRVSPLLRLMQFDTAVNPAGGGATLTYGYHRLTTPSTAAFREINKEYVDDEATTEKHSVVASSSTYSLLISRNAAVDGVVRRW